MICKIVLQIFVGIRQVNILYRGHIFIRANLKKFKEIPTQLFMYLGRFNNVNFQEIYRVPEMKPSGARVMALRKYKKNSEHEANEYDQQNKTKIQF